MSNRFLLLLALVALGCDSDPGHTPDATVHRDAALTDSGGLLDAGSRRDGAADAAPASDAGPAGFCWSAACDPRRPDCFEGSCVLWGEASSCEPAAGALAANASCESVADCAPGLACFATPDGGGTCGRICCPSEPDACVDGAVCGGSGVLVDGTATSWGRCSPPQPCDVLDPVASCGEREGCYIVDRAGTTECRVAGSADIGEHCAVQNDCQPGSFCGLGGRCVRICRLGAGDCPAGEGRCVAQVHSPPGTGFCTADSLL